MSKIEVSLNIPNLRAFRSSAEVQQMLDEYASNITNSLGNGYEYDVKPGSKRASARIRAVTDAARRDNLENNTMMKAVGR